MRSFNKLIGVTVLALVLFNCSGSKRQQFEHAGGTLVMSLANEPSTFIARKAADVYTATLLNQVLEGLVQLDPKTLAPVPAIAKSWEVSPDARIITFQIRDDVYFHEHPDITEKRKLTTEDIKFSIELACKKEAGENPSNAYFMVYSNLIGAKEYHENEADEIKGLSITENSVTIELVAPDFNFVDKLASIHGAIVLPELVKAGKEADLIGTGPFKIAAFEEYNGQSKYILVKNQAYYQNDEHGNALPYLDSLVFIVEPQSERQLELFEQGITHMVNGLPPSKISEILDENLEVFEKAPPKYILERSPVLSTHFYQFNTKKPPYDDVNVRRAISYAINREEITKKVLNNQAYAPGNAGLVPMDIFSGYNSDKVKKEGGYSYNPIKARELFAEAGYPNGENFPTLEITFGIGSIQSLVADEVAKQLKKTLNIDVSINGLPFEDKLNYQIYGKGDMIAGGWRADFFSPENFLTNCYGKIIPEDPNEPSILNHTRFSNATFDSLFEQGQSESDIRKKYNLFVEAETLMMKEAPYIILWYGETIKIVDSKVRDLNLNSLGYYNYVRVYLKEWSNEEYLQKINSSDKK